MRVWPVLLILMAACGTNVSTSPANPTSADQVVTEPDADPAETAVEAAVAKPDVGRDPGSDTPSEASPDAAPDVVQDSADAMPDARPDAPEAWVWHPYDSGRKPDVVDAYEAPPAGIPVDATIGQGQYRQCSSGDTDKYDTEIAVFQNMRRSATLVLNVATWGCCDGTKYFAPIQLCVGQQTSLDARVGRDLTDDIPGGCGTDETDPVVSKFEYVWSRYTGYDPDDTTYTISLGTTCGHAKVTGVIEVR